MNSKYFNAVVFTLLLIFFLVQAFCAYLNPVGLDEFHNLYLARKATELLPYRDWLPFKTTLGLYFDTIPFYILSDQWEIIHFSKILRISLVFAVIYWACSEIGFLGSKSSIILSLFLLCFNNYFLASSLELRPDLLNSLTGLISFILLLKGSLFYSGLFAALSFCFSQKGVIYFIAANVVLIAALFKKEKTLKEVFNFNYIFSVCLVAYFIFSSLQYSFLGVLTNVFTKHLYLLTERNYPKVYIYWTSLVAQNPVFTILTVFALLYALVERKKLSSLQLNTALYSFVIIFCCLLYPEPLPYFFILILPILFILNTISIDSLLKFNKHSTICLVLLGASYSFYVYCSSWKGEQAYQQIMTIVGEHLLEKDQRYFAGTSFLTFREQVSEDFAWIDMRKTKQLHDASEQEKSRLVKKFESNPPKFIYANYKIDNLPKTFVNYFEDRYYHYFGNIYVYSSEFEPSQGNKLQVYYPGDYVLLADKPVQIQGHLINPGEAVELVYTNYEAKSDTSFRLVYRPKLQLDSKYDRYRDVRD